MGNPTERMKWSLKNKLNYPDSEIAKMDYNAASNAIKNQVMYERIGTITPEQDYDIGAPRGDRKASMYVAYAKDLFIFLRAELAKVTKEPISNEIVMDEAISLISQAKEAFE